MALRDIIFRVPKVFSSISRELCFPPYNAVGEQAQVCLQSPKLLMPVYNKICKLKESVSLCSCVSFFFQPYCLSASFHLWSHDTDKAELLPTPGIYISSDAHISGDLVLYHGISRHQCRFPASSLNSPFLQTFFPHRPFDRLGND